MAGAGSISPAEISGMSPVLEVGALLGQMTLTKPQCGQAVSLFGPSQAEKPLLNEVRSAECRERKVVVGTGRSRWSPLHNYTTPNPQTAMHLMTKSYIIYTY